MIGVYILEPTTVAVLALKYTEKRVDKIRIRCQRNSATVVIEPKSNYRYKNVGRQPCERMFDWRSFIGESIVREKTIAITEFLAGILFLIIGAAVQIWTRQLYWIMIYPPPIQKQILDVLPYAIWAVSALLILDSVRRLLKSK